MNMEKFSSHLLVFGAAESLIFCLLASFYDLKIFLNDICSQKLTLNL